MPVTSIASAPMRELSNNNNTVSKDREEDGAKKVAVEDQNKPFPWQKPVPSKALRTSENYMLRYKCRKRPGGDGSFPSTATSALFETTHRKKRETLQTKSSLHGKNAENV